jgi:23S rRNA (guanosine2251-2'-O)-methyltransferase
MKLVVILDNVRSVHNVGSIFRTADAAGVSKIYCCGITPSPFDRFKKVRSDFAKVALGAEESVAWEAGRSASGANSLATLDVIATLKKDGWQIFAVEQAKNSAAYDKVTRAMHETKSMREAKVALVLGAEVEGVSPEVLAAADKILEIPMRGKKESLNVAVAFGIAAFEMMKPAVEK